MGQSERPYQSAPGKQRATRTAGKPDGAEETMAARSFDLADKAGPERLRDLARRCRDLSEMTAVPDVTRELLSIAQELEQEAGRVERD
jgi:hypothetical protein